MGFSKIEMQKKENEKIEMIEKIQIRGFGANEKLDVEFGPNVTSIIGKSFIGKSWLLRALKWVMRNKPAGNSYINWDSDEAKVRLSVDNKKVVRIRSKSINSYRLSGKSHPYLALAQSNVPKDISEIMNVSDINFQGQHTLPFWFCETAGEVSRQLNSIVNLEVIDKTLSNIESQKRKAKVLIEVTEQSLKEAVKEKKGLEYVEDLDVELSSVESIQKDYQTNAEKHARIDEKLNLVAKYASIQENRLRVVSDGSSVLSARVKYVKIADFTENLSNLIESVQELQDILDCRPPTIKPLRNLKEKLEQVTINHNDLDDLIEDIENRRKKKCQIEESLKSLKKRRQEIAGGHCPLCGKKLKS